jgi:hypothetical protein
MPVSMHKIKHYYQTTNHACSQAALATLLSFFGETVTPDEIAAKLPVNKNEKGEDWGTINQQLATWCISQGYDVELHTADFQILDLSWIGFAKPALVARMEAAKDKREVPALGKVWSKMYMQSYVDFVNAGGELCLHPFMSSSFIDSRLIVSPLLACVSYSVLHGSGRSKDLGLRKSEPDDIDGKLVNHSIVIYGKDESGNYLIADPWKEPGLHAVEPERLLAAMTSAQMECDNLFFQIKPKE